MLIDSNYDGEVFNIALTGVSERTQDLVRGRYEQPIPPGWATVAVKIVAMPGKNFCGISDLEAVGKY